MTASLTVERPGAGVAAQDFGRPGFRALGVPCGGALDCRLLAAANVLAGAPEDAAGLEILLAAPALRVESGRLRLGLAGGLDGVVTRANGAQRRVAAWRGVVLEAGERIDLRLLGAVACLGFSGGLALPEILGARATFLRGAFGGLAGRALVADDRLQCAPAEGGELSAPPLPEETGPLRFIAGPQAQRFTAEALEEFSRASWRVGADSDRMGLRLDGPRLAHRGGDANIVSDGATPGAIQVPGDGRPIVLRADCQTSGGYAKIGCVVSADLPRLAHVRPGDALTFVGVDHDAAARARAGARQSFARWRQGVTAAGADRDERLTSENLISGATAGDFGEA